MEGDVMTCQRSFAIVFLSATLMLQTVSCTTVSDPETRQLDLLAQQLVETDERMVQTCRKLGSVSRSADIQKMFGYQLERRNIQAIKRQAAQLGATHIVWLYRYKNSAAALAYSCRD
jgi:hypothetical protein